VVLEAMNYCVPVLAARIGGLPEMVIDNVTGLLFNAGDSGDLAEKMHRLWISQTDRERFAAAGRSRVAEKYSAGPYMEDLLSIYSQAIQSAPRAAGLNYQVPAS
jgi:glycosyltransferase involved in cell wall biosynthesis